MAENSRPRREYREDGLAKSKSCGRKRQKTKQDAVQTNWMQPFLWSQINQAAKRVGRPYCPRDIVKEVQRRNPKDFAQLREQTLGNWICPVAKSAGKFAWRESVLRQVVHGNRPGGESTRVGILVSSSIYLGLVTKLAAG